MMPVLPAEDNEAHTVRKWICNSVCFNRIA